jgi:hypothetical protein
MTVNKFRRTLLSSKCGRRSEEIKWIRRLPAYKRK